MKNVEEYFEKKAQRATAIKMAIIVLSLVLALASRI